MPGGGAVSSGIASHRSLPFLVKVEGSGIRVRPRGSAPQPMRADERKSE